MRDLGKLFCFLSMIGMALGMIFSLSGMIHNQRLVGPCSSEQECQEHYVQNLLHCFSQEDGIPLTNVCGDAIDPPYKTVTEVWPERRNKFYDIAKKEQQKLPPDVFRAKQEQISSIIKEHYRISERKIALATGLFLIALLLPFVCLIADLMIGRKAQKIMFQEEAPSTQIMILLIMFFISVLASIGIVIHDGLSPLNGSLAVMAIAGVLSLVVGLLGAAVLKEGQRFKNFIHAVKQAKPQKANQ